MKETILYVDDEVVNLELFKANFENEYDVITAESGQEGLNILKSKNKINVIISDIKMPGMNGFEFINRVKSSTPDKVCIVLSAFLRSDIEENPTNEKDIYRYLNKPWRKPEMKQVIIEAIDSYQSLQAV